MAWFYTVGSLFIFYTVAFVHTSPTDTVCHSFNYCQSCPKDTNGNAVCTACYQPLYCLSGEPSVPCIPCSFFNGCLKCSNSTFCDLCYYPGLLGPDYGGIATCSSCAKNCLYCKNAGGGKCDTAAAGYFVDPTTKTCSECPANCLECADGDTCKFCNKRYYLKTPTACASCPANCDYCWNSTTCKTCTAGYTMNASGTSCTNCAVANCATCDSTGKICTKCSTGVPSQNGSSCVASVCPEPNCIECTANGVCTQYEPVAPSS